MDAAKLEAVLDKKQNALEKIEHAVAQKKLKPDKVNHTVSRTGTMFCFLM